MLGRSMPGPGEPLFLPEDYDYLMALAEEEDATCPSCGQLKAVCRDPAYQFAYEVKQEQCHATYALAAFQDSKAWEAKAPATQKATQLALAFRDGVPPPPIDVGLELEALTEHEDDGGEKQ